MFETAELGRALDATEYDQQVPELRTRLLKAQLELGHADFPVVVLLHGLDTIGANEVFNVLHEWFDTRYLVTEAWEPPTEEERERPGYWRFWQWLPPKGKIGIFLGSWYTQPLLDRARGKLDGEAFGEAMERAAAFEKELTDNGATIIKLWLHVTQRDQKARMKEFRRDKSLRYRLSRRVVKEKNLYEDLLDVCGRMITRTSLENAPWTIVEAGDRRYRNVCVGREIAQTIEKHLQEAREERPKRGGGAPEVVSDPITVLDTLDLSRNLSRDEYKERLGAAQVELSRLAYKLEKRRQSAIVVFEGWDAAGKGGAIRRITGSLDAHQYRVIPIGAPTEEERAYHYLWRFWRRLPRRGRFTIYDRSWYGRVLVERVENFATEKEWQRAYPEINDFEAQLAEEGVVIVKYWLHISQEEQLRRFEARKAEPWKQYKLTDEDFRNRRKSADYEAAVNDMVARTDTVYAPWTLVEAEDKRYARVKVVETLCKHLRDAL